MESNDMMKAQEAKEQQIEEIKNRKPRMAICYDFDKTLSPDDMRKVSGTNQILWLKKT